MNVKHTLRLGEDCVRSHWVQQRRANVVFTAATKRLLNDAEPAKEHEASMCGPGYVVSSMHCTASAEKKPGKLTTQTSCSQPQQLQRLSGRSNAASSIM